MVGSTEWYVRTDDGKVYGPADSSTLLTWAKEGRIEPTSHLSLDRVTWTPAPLDPRLDMKWIVETRLGRLFGPFHHDVVSRLINEKIVPPSARIFRLYDGEQEQGAVAVVDRRPPARVTPTVGFGMFGGVDSRKLAALERAARNELETMRRRGLRVGPFAGVK